MKRLLVTKGEMSWSDWRSPDISLLSRILELT